MPTPYQSSSLFRILSAASVLLGAQAALAQNNTVVWDGQSAQAVGNGCRPGTVAFIPAGNDLTILFSELGVHLPVGSAQPVAETRNCNITVQAQVARGVYLAEFSQLLNYSVQKTARSKGSIATQSIFFGNPLKFLRREHPEDEVINLAQDVNVTASETFGVNAPARWCNQATPLAGKFISKIRSHGQRHGATEGITLLANEQDVRFQVTASFQFCPL